VASPTAVAMQQDNLVHDYSGTYAPTLPFYRRDVVQPAAITAMITEPA